MEKSHLLATQSEAQYVIAVDSEAHETEQYAARELAHYLERITGAFFRVSDLRRLDGTFPIIIGFNSLSDLFAPLRDNKLGDDGFIIRSVDYGIIIAGEKPRGTLYGVYAFLEKLGVRFLATDETVIPAYDELYVPYLDIRETPAFMYRNPYYRLSQNPDWSARNRCNGAPAASIHGGYMKNKKLATHTFSKLVPPERYFADHPEYFSMIGGVRTAENSQLCLTNPDVRKIIYDNFREKMLTNPAANMHSLSINDCHNPCECPDCQEIDLKSGSHAGSLLTLLNKLAEDLEKEFPDVVIGTLAYLHTRKPPEGIAVRHNVHIWLCSIECCRAHPIDECVDVSGPRAGQSTFPLDLAGWAALTKNLYVWDYMNNFDNVSLPHPNFQVLQPNMQFLHKNGVAGVFAQGHTLCENGTPDLNELRYYLLAKLMWDPYCDIASHTNDFLRGYYGAAAEHIENFIGIFQNRIAECGVHFGTFAAPTSACYDDVTIEQADSALVKALEAVRGTKKYETRVCRVMLLTEYVRLAKKAMTGVATHAEMEDFFSRFASMGYDHLEEAMPLGKRRAYFHEMGRLCGLVDGCYKNLYEPDRN